MMIRLSDQVTDSELAEWIAEGRVSYRYGPQVWAIKRCRCDMRPHNVRKFIRKHGVFLEAEKC